MDRDAHGESEPTVPWERHANRDIMLVAIDAGPTMRVNGNAPLLEALHATATLLEGKLVSSPYDHVGIVLWNTASSRMLSESKNGFQPHMVEYRQIKQVDVPDTYMLQELIRRAESSDPEVLERDYPAAKAQTSIEHVLSNALQLLTSAARAGSRRVFYMTNQDDPFPRAKEREQRACIAVVKDFFRRGVDIEPFFMSTGHAFAINAFYADIIGEYDDGIADETTAPWRLRVMQDQNMSKRRAWDAEPKFAELAQHGEGRAGLKNSIFDLNFDLGEVDDGHWVITVKGYALVADRGRDIPVRVSSFGREDPLDLDEIIAHQELFDDMTGQTLSKDEVQHLFLLGGTNGVSIPITEDELRDIKESGHVPGIALIGFDDVSRLRLVDNIKHACFLYPSDLRQAGSKCAFAALQRSMLAKDKYALCTFMPRKGVTPYYVAVIPQAEELDHEGNQLVPPGMNMIPLPYADDVRVKPVCEKVEPSSAQVEAAEALIRSYTRKEPFNPDVYTNPVMRYHYDALKAVAFERPAPTYTDTIVPDYATIAERSGLQIASWKSTFEGSHHTHIQVGGPKSERIVTR
ncbi:ATP-dependent DNA helicase II subunit 1 [Malassezia cuniculi]|uniref:ATP-dependent DNA helicase II subunit 1 n=1 Tax=Malassezia cuniculi TaxID=948313 RepID=A0AAF0EXG4_9BASI|nr:ATP-dependent DNA helicase II subunit 1 [Malassezia cuniculi]